MLVAVVNTIEIPHVVRLGAVEYVFEPQTEVPDEVAKKIIANQPKVFFAVGDKVLDVSEYKVKDVFQGKTIEEIFNSFPQKERMEIYALVKKKALEVRKRNEKIKEAEIIASKPVVADALQSALGLTDVPKESLEEAVSGDKKPKINKVR